MVRFCPFGLFILSLAVALFGIQSSAFAADIRFANDNIFFQASSIKATFRDGSKCTYDSDDIVYNSTIIGDYLSFTQDDNSTQVRLYFIPPALDWRSNQTYHWKLNQAWMADEYYGWIFWNVNGFVDSFVQMSESDSVNNSSQIAVFSIDYMEFSFHNSAPPSHFGKSQGKLVLKEVKLAALLSSELDVSSLTVYNPCGDNNEQTTTVVNGKITCGYKRGWKYGATIVSFLVALVAVACTRRQRYANSSTRYNTVSQETTEQEDHDDDDER